MSIGSGIIYIRIQLLKCGKNMVCAYDYSEIELSGAVKTASRFNN